MALPVKVEEVESVAVHAQPVFIEVGTVLVSVLASSLAINGVAFDAFEAGRALRVVFGAVFILEFAQLFVGQGVALLA